MDREAPRPQLAPHDVPVRAGWALEAPLLAATIGSAPTMALSDARDVARAYVSTRFAWQGWDVLREARVSHVPFDGGWLFLRTTPTIDLCGTVADMPWIEDLDTVYAAALGKSGSWFAPVSGRGWFDFRDLPAGEFRIVVYQRPVGPTGVALHDRGEVRGETRVATDLSRYDIVVPWAE